jgi:anti-anti-sigma factor
MVQTAIKEVFEVIEEQGEIQYGEKDGVMVLRLIGAVRYTTCCSLSNFVAELFERHSFEKIVIDLTRAESIDSTNLGILAKIAKYADTKLQHKPLLVCDNPAIKEVIASMGIDEIYRYSLDCETDCKVFNKLANAVENNGLNLNKVMLDAHQELSILNDKNRDEFEGVLEVLQGGV